MKIAALILAAGRGQRFEEDLPKQYYILEGRPILRHSLALFSAHPAVTTIQTVIHPDDRTLYNESARGFDLSSPVFGGETRQDSVRMGLESLARENPDLVLIHDGARPFVDFGVIDRVLTGLESTPAVIPAISIRDTIKRSDGNGQVVETVDRSNLYASQTPQGFEFSRIFEAHHQARGENLTDDAAVARKAGLSVRIVKGDSANVKITSKADLLYKKSRGGGDIRTGSGFDVHGFKEGDQISLCGVDIPCDSALRGHSDADVALHAVTDALLGAIGAGDIGAHFPADEIEWKDRESEYFVRHTCTLVQAMGGEITNVDLSLICEKPKINAYRSHMSARLAEILDLPVSRVNIKATTTEGLGFTGRREGIAATATATVRMG